MPRYVRTISFSTSARFDSDKDDSEVNKQLQHLYDSGATGVEIKVLLSRGETGATSLYVIEYEAPAPVR